MTNGAKNCQVDISVRPQYAIEVKAKGQSFGLLNGTQNLEDGVCLKIYDVDSVGYIMDPELVKRFLDTRSANCSIAGTKRMMKHCTSMYFINMDLKQNFDDIHYKPEDFKFSVVTIKN